jgi:hypothetical protein
LRPSAKIQVFLSFCPDKERRFHPNGEKILKPVWDIIFLEIEKDSTPQKIKYIFFTIVFFKFQVQVKKIGYFYNNTNHHCPLI